MFKPLILGLLLGVAPIYFGFAESGSKGSPRADIFKRAEDLVLNGERSKALDLLRDQWEQSTGKDKAEISQKMDDLSRVFITEKGQKAFELGQSLSAAKVELAKRQYQLALEAEDSNLAVLLALAGLNIRRQEWSPAATSIQQALQIHPGSEEVLKLEVLLLLHQDQLQEAKEKMKALDVSAKDVDLQLAQVQISYLEKDLERAKAIARGIHKSFPEVPEVHYWIWKLQGIQNQTEAEAAQKYLKLCKDREVLGQRQVNESPFYCQSLAEVEKIIDEKERQSR